MNKKILLTAALFILAVSTLAWIARPTGTNNTANLNNLKSASNGILAATETSFNFGDISMAAGKVSHNFTVKNTGTEAVAIEKIYTSCMCTEATLNARGETHGPFGMAGHGFIPKISVNLNPGEEAQVSAVFDPAAHGPAGVGKIQRSVYLENNAGEPLELHFSATVTP